MRPRLCERCGHGFWSRSPRHRFCSDKCRDQVADEKKAEHLRARALRQPDPRSDYILAEWEKGRSLKQIALELGISRERVSQLIGRLNGRVRDNVQVAIAAREIGIDADRVRQWIARGLLSYGPNQTVTVEAVRAAYEVVTAPRHCKTCGAAFRSTNPIRVHCDLHIGSVAGPIKYAEWSARRRRNHTKLVLRWKREHPELAKATNRRARLVYRLVAEGMPRERARVIARDRHPDPLPAEKEAVG